MVPPIRTAQVGFQVFGRFTGDNKGRCHKSSDNKKKTKNSDDHSKSLKQVKISDPNGFGRSHVENNRYPVGNNN